MYLWCDKHEFAGALINRCYSNVTPPHIYIFNIRCYSNVTPPHIYIFNIRCYSNVTPPQIYIFNILKQNENSLILPSWISLGHKT